MPINGSLVLKTDNVHETIWLTQDQMATLFDVLKAAISKRVKNIFDSDELREKSVVSILEDLDDWLYYYNHARTHQGKMCCVRTPIDTLIDGRKIWQEKVEGLSLSRQ